MEKINVSKPVAISIKELHKSYGKHHVLKGLNLEVYQGELFGFVGMNGVGKSTTIDCMIGAKKFDQGEIKINGHDIKDEACAAKRSFGYTSSEPTAYEMMTGNEYLEFMANIYEMREEAFEKNRAYLIVNFGFSEVDMNKLISAYSHGMKQKICLMASLIHNPRIWIMDEPTVGLDIIVFETLKDMIQKFTDNEGTVFITSHNIDLVAKICDRVALVKDGNIAELIDLKANPDRRYSLAKTFLSLYKEEKR